jgi:hypothetical protein
VMTWFSLSWLVMTAVMVLMLWRLGPDHPPVMNPYEPLPASRYVLAVVAVIMFALCFMLVPLDPADFGPPEPSSSQHTHRIDVHGGPAANLRP